MNINISKDHRYGTDSILLSEFAGKVKNKVVVDLCSGCGIIPFTLKAAKQLYAVEIQREAAELIRRTVGENNINNITVIEGDLREQSALSRIGREVADMVTANPPYYREGSGYERESDSHRTARYECDCNLDDVVKAANHLLKYGGELKLCMTASRLAETIGLMQGYSIEPKEIVLIPAKQSNTARLFLISGKKGAKPGVNVVWK